MHSWIQCNVTRYSENVTEVLSSDMFSKKLKQAVVGTDQEDQRVRMVEEIGRTRFLERLNAEAEHCYTKGSVSWKYLWISVVVAALKCFSHTPFLGNSLPTLSVGAQISVEQLLNSQIYS